MKIVNKPIEIIAVFMDDGKIIPKRVRLTNDDDTYTVFDVDTIIKRDAMKIDGKKILRFTCSSTIEGYKKAYEIRFYQESLKWLLYSI